MTQARRATFPELDEPILPLTRRRSGPSSVRSWASSSRMPTSPRTSRGPPSSWRPGGSSSLVNALDGVLSVDPVAMSYLLGATGPHDGGRSRADGGQRSGRAAEPAPTCGYEDPAAQDAFFRDVARQVFDAVSSGVGSPQTLIEALARGAGEGCALPRLGTEHRPQLADGRWRGPDRRHRRPRHAWRPARGPILGLERVRATNMTPNAASGCLFWM